MRSIILLALLTMVSIWLSAQSVESFDYPQGSTLEGLESTGNWGGPWTTLKGNDQTSIETGGIDAPGVSANSGGNHLFVNHDPGAGENGARFFRLLDSPVSDDGETYYLSWFMEADYEDPGTNGSVWQMIITNSAAYGAGGPGGQLVRMGKQFNTERFSIDGVAGASGNIEGTDTREGNWYVAVVQMSGDAEAEQLHIFVNPNPLQPLDFTTADITLAPTLNNGFDAIGAKIEGPAPLSGNMDEIRFGTSFAEVVSGDLIPIAGLAQDQLNTDAGENMGGSSGGNGWAAPWNIVGGPQPTFIEGGFQNFTLLRETSGNRVQFDFTEANGNTRIERPLFGSYPDDGSTYYVSFHTQSSITNNAGTVAFLMLVDTAAYQAGGPGGQLVQIGKPLNTAEIGVGFGSQPADFALSGAFSDAPHLVVARIRTSGDAEADTVDIFIDPTLDMEPAEPDATRIFDTRLNNGFNGIGIKVEGLGPGIITEYDDIYVGLEYADVIPQDYEVLQNPVSALAVERFSYTAGDTLEGLGEMSEGWAGPWESLFEPDSSVVMARGVFNDELLVRTNGNSAQVTSDGTTNRFQRLFAEPFESGEEFWFSTHLSISGNPAGNVGTFILVDTTIAGEGFRKVIMGKQFGNRNVFVTGGGGPQQTGVQFEGAAGRWLVGHMTHDGTQWLLDLWVDPDPGATPDEADANIMNRPYADGDFHGVLLQAEGAAGVNLLVDDIYFGNLFTDIVPPDWNPIPPPPPGASEKVEYMANSGLDGQDGGEGFDGAWTLLTTADATITEPGIENFNLLKQTSGQKITVDENGRFVRRLSGEYGDVGRTYWLGYFFDTDEAGGNVQQFVLADADTYMDGGPGGQLAQIGRAFNAVNLGIVGNGATDFPADEGHFVVLEIVTNGTAANDELYMWVDPDLNNTPSRDTAHLVGGADLTNWNALGFKVEGGEGSVATWDDILLGYSFQDVVPNDLIDILPPEIPIPAVESFDYAVGENLNTRNGGEGWGGPWSQAGGEATIGDGSIDTDRVTLAGNKAQINQSSTPVEYDRPFFNRFATSPGEIWVSFLMDVETKNIGNSAQVQLSNEGAPVLSIGGVPGLENIGVVYNGDTQETSTTESILGTTWFVARINTDGGPMNDTVRIWINPVPDALPAEQNALFTLQEVDLNNGFDAVRLFASGVGNTDMAVDEFRIGFSFRDVSNKFGSDDPNLLAYEPFNYDAQTSLIGSGGINAFWDGVWENFGNLAENEPLITEGSTAFPEFETIGNKVEVNYVTPSTQIRLRRPLAFPMESDGSTYWLTWFQNTTTGDKLNNVSNVMLLNPSVPANAGQRINIGRMFGNGKLGMISPPNNTPFSSEVDDLGLNWIVAKIQTVEDAAVRDTVWLWVNPDPTAEPDTANAELITSNTGFTARFFTLPFLKESITHIGIKVEGVNGDETPHIVEFDEIRLATVWESAATIVNTVEPELEDAFALAAFPNPVVDHLNIQFDLPRKGRVLLTVHDTQGRLVHTLQNGTLPEGSQSINWNVGERNSGVANGIYFLRLAQDDNVSVRKLILLR